MKKKKKHKNPKTLKEELIPILYKLLKDIEKKEYFSTHFIRLA